MKQESLFLLYWGTIRCRHYVYSKFHTHGAQRGRGETLSAVHRKPRIIFIAVLPLSHTSGLEQYFVDKFYEFGIREK